MVHTLLGGDGSDLEPGEVGLENWECLEGEVGAEVDQVKLAKV